MSRIYLNEVFSAAWGDDTGRIFEEAFKLDGENYRLVKSRKTLRFEFAGRPYFVKLHRGVGWREIFKDLFQGKIPVLGAANEFNALNLLQKHGLPTMTPAGFGERNFNPARRESFLITEELTGMVSLEDFVLTPRFAKLRSNLLVKLASHAGKMHHLGINHRDCYICHYLLLPEAPPEATELFVIDLHRAQLRKQIPKRFQIKDLSGLLFSAMDLGLSKAELLKFTAVYCRKLEDTRLLHDRKFWATVQNKARKLYRKVHHKNPPALPW